MSCYILADTFFISNRFGINGLAALNLAIPIFSFIAGVGLMLGMGGATEYSVAHGRKKVHDANRAFTGTLMLGLIAAVIFETVGLALSEKITFAMGADENIFEMTVTYISMALGFSPAFVFNNIMQCFVRNDGNPRLTTAAMVSGSLSNIVLDYIFIYPLDMGIFGAVLATGLAPIISLCILSTHVLKKKNKFKLCKTHLTARFTTDTASLGFPSLIAEVSSGVVIIVFNTIILRISGNVGVAAYGVVANLSLVVVSIYTGIAQGVQPLLSLSHGKNESAEVKIFARYALLTTAVVSALIYLVIFVFAEPIAHIFNSENDFELQAMAVRGLKMYFTAVLFVGFNIVISVYFTSTEDPRPAQAISLTRGLLLIVPMAFALSSLLGTDGVWLAFPATEGLVGLGALLYMKLGSKY